MKILYGVSFFILCVVFFTQPFKSYSQIQQLSILGQTPGGAGFHTNWDSLNQRLIVGCGTSIWVYDMTSLADPVIIAKRPLKGIVNETDVYGNVLFAAATHDGLYAFDYTSPDLNVIAHIDMHASDSAAYDLWRSNDTLYVATKFNIRMYRFSGSAFQYLGAFGPLNSFCVARRGDYIVAGGQGALYLTPTIGIRGCVSVYHKSNLLVPVATWQDSLFNFIQDVQFADLRDDIIYVCAGPENALFSKSNLIALQFTGSSLNPVDTFSVTGGIPFFAQLNIMNMDSRNDTLYVVTTAAWDGTLPALTYMPILDATGLPADTMRKIGTVTPGLWHFDAALMDGTPYIAMSSEWLGFIVSDITSGNPYDTLGIHNTGGWCVNNRFHDGTLWACHEGYGLVGYNRDSLLYSNGFHCDSKTMHIMDFFNNHYFSSDVEFLNDSLMMLNNSEVYNISDWQQGVGDLQLAWDMNKNWMVHMRNIETNIGQRMVATFDNLTGKQWISLFNPFSGGYANLAVDTTLSPAGGMFISGDTVYYGKSINNYRYLYAVKAENDQFIFLDSVKLNMGFPFWPLDHAVESIWVENGVVIVAYGQQFAWFTWSGNQLQQSGMEYEPSLIADGVVLKNNYAYIADRMYGMKVFDLSVPGTATLVAQAEGTGGWTNLYGSTSISVDSNGDIYLSDFHGGVFLIDAFDTSLQPIHEMTSTGNLLIYPNPTEGKVFLKDLNIKKADAGIRVFSADGRRIAPSIIILGDQIQIDCSGFPDGLYLIQVFSDGKAVGTGKFILSRK